MVYLSAEFINELGNDVGMIGFAVAGLLAVQDRKVDPVGVFVAVFCTAFGGGIIRDILFDLRPFWWSSHPVWIWVCLFIALFAPHMLRHLNSAVQQRLAVFADATGLAFFAVGSCATGLALGHYDIVSVLVGVATGVFGGMLRDVFTGKIPAVVSDEQPYASLAFVGCWIYLLMVEILGWNADASLWICCALIIIVRMLCVYGGLPLRVRYVIKLSAAKRPHLHMPGHGRRGQKKAKNSQQKAPAPENGGGRPSGEQGRATQPSGRRARRGGRP
jgi:uncharacterized membrane protein YeiH